MFCPKHNTYWHNTCLDCDAATELQETQEEVSLATKDRDAFKAALQHIALGTWTRTKTSTGLPHKSAKAYASAVLAKAREEAE